MTTIPDSVARAREAYRKARVPEGYSGPRHLATIVVISLAIILGSLWMLEDVRPLEWLTVPLTLLYSNLAEYLGHRGPMHHRRRFLDGVYRRHTVEHHAFFTDEAISFESSRDYRAVLFPPVLLLFFFGLFALPVGALLYFLASPNVCYLFVATAMAYYLNYELFHFAYHTDPESVTGRSPLIRRLRRNHVAHHDRALMTRYNFNITYPLCDWLFGTLYRQGGRDGDPGGQAGRERFKPSG